MPGWLSARVVPLKRINDVLFLKFIVLILLLITSANPLYAKMYKWVDQHGIVTYSNVAPPSSAQQVTTIKESGDSTSKTSFVSATGIYFREDNTKYMELHSDGSFFLYEGATRQYRGKYRIDGRKLTLSIEGGKTVSSTIESNILIDPHGHKWKKKLTKTQRTRTNVTPSSSAQQEVTAKQWPAYKQPEPGEAVLVGPLVASGTIKDQSNKTLSDVRVYVTEIALVDREYNRGRSVIVHDGNFKITCDNCSAMTLSFSKKGYYSTKAEALYSQKRSGGTSLPESLVVNQDGTIPVVEQTNMKVILKQLNHDKSAKLVFSLVAISSGTRLEGSCSTG